MTDAERQTAFLKARFSELLKADQFSIIVETNDELITVSYTHWFDKSKDFSFLMEIGSDDDRYRFELWLDGRDTGIYVEFAFEGETL